MAVVVTLFWLVKMVSKNEHSAYPNTLVKPKN